MEEDRKEQMAQKLKIQNQKKIDDNNFLDSWKVRMKQLERDEKEEKNNKITTYINHHDYGFVRFMFF